MRVHGRDVALEGPLEGLGIGALRKYQDGCGNSRKNPVPETHGVLPIRFFVSGPIGQHAQCWRIVDGL
jgi:hypothetical protein